MTGISLKGYRVNAITFVNKLPNKTKIELGNKYNYNLRHTPTAICEGEMSVEVMDKNDPDKFCIKVELVGVFSNDGGLPKERLHVESFKVLFPYVRALITTITANAGIPPIFIPQIDIESQNIYSIDMRKPEEE